MLDCLWIRFCCALCLHASSASPQPSALEKRCYKERTDAGLGGVDGRVRLVVVPPIGWRVEHLAVQHTLRVLAPLRVLRLVGYQLLHTTTAQQGKLASYLERKQVSEPHMSVQGAKEGAESLS